MFDAPSHHGVMAIVPPIIMELLILWTFKYLPVAYSPTTLPSHRFLEP